MNYISTLTSSASPLHYWLNIQKEVEPTWAMEFGSALHCFLLEKTDFHNRYEVVEAPTNQDGSIKASEKKKIQSEKILIPAQVLQYFEKIEKLTEQKKYSRLLEKSTREHSCHFSWDTEKQDYCNIYEKEYYNENLLFLSGRIDAYFNSTLIEIKTTTPQLLSNSRALRYAVLDRGYIMQLKAYAAGLRLQGIEIDNLLLIFVSNDIEVPIIQAFSIDFEDEYKENERLIQRLNTIHRCFSENSFDVFSHINDNEIMPLGMKLEW